MSSSHPLSLLPSDKEPWYKEGLCFSCTGCGGCCTGAPGYVWVSQEEIAKMAEFLEISVSLFLRRYVRMVHGRYSLTERKSNYDCIFLEEGKRCSIYSVRPTQCRTFPYWPENLASKEAWEAAKEHCEGIRSDAERICFEEIERQRKLQEQAEAISKPS